MPPFLQKVGKTLIDQKMPLQSVVLTADTRKPGYGKNARPGGRHGEVYLETFCRVLNFMIWNTIAKSFAYLDPQLTSVLQAYMKLKYQFRG